MATLTGFGVLLLACTHLCAALLPGESSVPVHILSNKAITVFCSARHGVTKIKTSAGDSLDVAGDGLFSCFFYLHNY